MLLPYSNPNPCNNFPSSSPCNNPILSIPSMNPPFHLPLLMKSPTFFNPLNLQPLLLCLPQTINLHSTPVLINSHQIIHHHLDSSMNPHFSLLNLYLMAVIFLLIFHRDININNNTNNLCHHPQSKISSSTQTIAISTINQRYSRNQITLDTRNIFKLIIFK